MRLVLLQVVKRLGLQIPFQQLRLRRSVNFGIIFGSDKYLEILVRHRFFEVALEFVIHPQLTSIFRSFVACLGPHYIGLSGRS